MPETLSFLLHCFGLFTDHSRSLMRALSKLATQMFKCSSFPLIVALWVTLTLYSWPLSYTDSHKTLSELHLRLVSTCFPKLFKKIVFIWISFLLILSPRVCLEVNRKKTARNGHCSKCTQDSLPADLIIRSCYAGWHIHPCLHVWSCRWSFRLSVSLGWIGGHSHHIHIWKADWSGLGFSTSCYNLVDEAPSAG